MIFMVISFASKNVCGCDAILCFQRPNPVIDGNANRGTVEWATDPDTFESFP
jgi:hypothetical protein